MNSQEIQKLRDRGLTVATASGEEALRVSAQCRLSLGHQTWQERCLVLGRWQEDVQQQLARFGGEVVPGSLSVAGQSVEAVIPVKDLPQAEAALAEADIRLDLIVPRQVVSGTERWPS